MKSPVILLHENDNVVVCRRRVHAGEPIEIGPGETVVAHQNVEVGHKLARVRLTVGHKIIKYGASIGSATAEVAAGDWVHLHNMKSDYISVTTRAATGESE